MMLSFILCALALFISLFLILLPLATLLLAAVATFRTSWSSCNEFRTAIYSGRVTHTRYQPMVHGFSYPLFFCYLDLDEIDALFGSRGALWPLSWFMTFSDVHHLKNEEGMEKAEDEGWELVGTDNGLKARLCRFIAAKTKGRFSPTEEKHRIMILTHLEYYGYCFNPVSFYYSFDRESGNLEAMVAEVSNTPWNEMRCYVLHKDSVDVEHVGPGRSRKGRGSEEGGTKDDKEGEWKSTNYVFRKAFHVSPFMDMDHTYDWTFWDAETPLQTIAASTTMLKKGSKFFNANFEITRQKFHPLNLCWQLIRLPVYCAIVQIWIHWEAAFLFAKGATYFPHPEGSETTASRLIGNVMIPFFALKGWLNGESSEDGALKEDLKKEKVS